MKYAYKLLRLDLTTHGGYQWVVGETKTASGEGPLCGPGWLHGYEHAEIAHFLNPIHANFTYPVLYRVLVGGHYKRDGQIKAGWTEMTLVEPVDVPLPTTEQRVRFALYCALAVYKDAAYVKWALGWLSGGDRSSAEAAAVWAASGVATRATAEAAMRAAAEAAASATRAAARASAWAAWAVSGASAWAAWGTSAVNLRDAAIYAYSDRIYPDFIEVPS